MKKRQRIICISCAFVLCLITVCAATGLNISPSLEIIEDRVELKKCTLIKNCVNFSSDDFDSALSQNTQFITITSLPSSDIGELYLDKTRVMENQIISRKDFDSLYFQSVCDEPGCAAFSFEDSKDSDTRAICTINVLDHINLSPETGSQVIETQKNISAFKFLLAADPENDDMTFEIVKYPKNGYVRIADEKSGRIEYVPNKSYVGKDSFVYKAKDVFGNISGEQKVQINVVKPATDAYFDDMKKHWAHNSAVKMSATGLMSAKEQDGKLNFEPENAISRGDFLAIALIMTGYEDKIPLCENTSFADDSQIPQNIKSYAQYALDNGIVSGYHTPEGAFFKSTSPITRAEAFVIIDRVLSLPESDGASVVFTDAASIPDWAGSATRSLFECGILNGTGNLQMKPEGTLTKGMAAEMICNVATYLEDKENQMQNKEKFQKKSLFNLFGLLH